VFALLLLPLSLHCCVVVGAVDIHVDAVVDAVVGVCVVIVRGVFFVVNVGEFGVVGCVVVVI